MKTVVLAVAFAALAAAQSPPPPPPSGDSVLVLPVHLVGLTSGNLPADASADLISTFAFEISSFLNQELVGYAQVLVPGGSGIHVNITSRLDSQWATVVSMIPVLQSPSLANVLAQSMFAIANSPIFADAMPNTIAAASKIASIDVKLSAAPPAVRPASNPAPAPTELPPPPSQPAVCTLITTLQLSDVAVADLTASLFFGVVESALRGFVAATLAASTGVAAPLRSMYVTASAGPSSPLTGSPSTLLSVTAGVPQPVPGVYGLLADAERAPLVSPLTSAFAFGGLNAAIRVVPGVSLTAAWSLVSVTAAPGAPSPRPPQPWLPSLPPNPFSTIVAAAQATIELTGLVAENVTADDAAALADALLSEVTAWAARAVPSSTFVLLAQPVVTIPSLPSAQADLRLSVSFGVYGFPALANVLARAMGAVLGTPFLAAKAVPGTIALASQLSGGAPITVMLIAASASAADAGGDPLSTPLPSPAPPSTKAALTFIIRLAGITAAQLQEGGAAAWSKVQTAVADAVAAAVAAPSGAGVSLNPSTVAVSIDASSSSSAADAQLRGGRALTGLLFGAPVAAGSSVSIAAAAPVTEPAPGTAGLVASAANAAFQSSPALLSSVTSAASAAAGGAAVTAEVSSASAGPSQPLNGPSSGGDGGAIAGGVIGALAALGVAAAGVVYVRRRRGNGSSAFGSVNVGRWMRLPATSGSSSSSAATALLPAPSAPATEGDPMPTYGSA